MRKPFKMFEVDYRMVTFSSLCVCYVYYPLFGMEIKWSEYIWFIYRLHVTTVPKSKTTFSSGTRYSCTYKFPLGCDTARKKKKTLSYANDLRSLTHAVIVLTIICVFPKCFHPCMWILFRQSHDVSIMDNKIVKAGNVPLGCFFLSVETESNM